MGRNVLGTPLEPCSLEPLSGLAATHASAHEFVSLKDLKAHSTPGCATAHLRRMGRALIGGRYSVRGSSSGR